MTCSYCGADLIQRDNETLGRFKTRLFCDMDCYNGARGCAEKEAVPDASLAEIWLAYNRQVGQAE